MAVSDWMDRPPKPRKIPEYTVGDHINLVAAMEHRMHLVEARIVYEHTEIEGVSLILEGDLVDLSSAHEYKASELRVSQKVEVEDVPGTYRVSHVEVVTASTRTLTQRPEGAGDETMFKIVSEPDKWVAVVAIDRDRTGPLEPSDWEMPEEGGSA